MASRGKRRRASRKGRSRTWWRLYVQWRETSVLRPCQRADEPAMWPFLDKPTAHTGNVFFRGPIAPPAEQVLALGTGDVAATRAEAPKGVEAAWAVRLT